MKIVELKDTLGLIFGKVIHWFALQLWVGLSILNLLPYSFNECLMDVF